MKGGGAISDAERAMLAQAVSNLNQSQSEEKFRATLTDLITRLEGNVEVTPTVSAEEQELIDAGYSPAEREAIKNAK